MLCNKNTNETKQQAQRRYFVNKKQVEDVLEIKGENAEVVNQGRDIWDIVAAVWKACVGHGVKISPRWAHY